MRTSTFLAIALFATTATFSLPLRAQEPVARQLEPLPPQQQQGFDSIDLGICKAWLTYLASDELQGRETGRPGYQMAAEFVAMKYRQFGLKPVGDDGTYFQHVPFTETGPDLAKSYLAVLVGDREILRVTPGKGLGGRMSTDADHDAPIVDVVAAGADDVDGAKIRDMAVLFTDQGEGGRRFSTAMRAVYQARPSLILTVDDAVANAPVTTSVRRPSTANRSGRSRRSGPATFSISTAVATEIRAALAEHGDKVRVKAQVVVTSKPVFGANVIGLLEGSDPALKHEVVGIGAHLDHTGMRGTQINNGADDDGSGSVGVLAIARAFHQNGSKPRRSILFMCFAGEEKGLVGSGYYANNPVIPNEDMVAMLQLDMIGRDEESVDRRTGEVREAAADNVNVVHLVGSKKLSMDLHEICVAKNAAHVGLDFEYDQEGVWGASDHAQFARKDIPVVFFFTGFHPDYHRPTDTVEKINFPKMVRIIQLAYAVAFEAADRPERIRRDRKYAEIQRTRRSR